MDDAVDHAAGDDGFADGGGGGPLGAVGEEVADGDGEVVVGVHQAGGWGDDAVAVGVGVVAEGDAVFVFEFKQVGHGVGAGAVHANFAVVIDGHEGEGGVELFVDDGQIEFVGVADGFPVVQRCAAEGIDADFYVGGTDGGDVDDIGEVVDVGGDVIVSVRGWGLDGGFEGFSFDAGVVGFEVLVGLVLDPAGGVGVGGAAVDGVVFEAAVGGGVVGGGDDDAVAES